MTNAPRWRFPPVLWRKVCGALDALSSLGHEETMDLLARYRRNRCKRIATQGVLNPRAWVDGLEPIPFAHQRAIERLDEAFEELHHYRDGGAGDYSAIGVESEINRRRAQQPRTSSHEHGEICAWMRRKGYEASDDKRTLIADAVSFFGTSESTVRRAIRAGGLARKKRTAVT